MKSINDTTDYDVFLQSILIKARFVHNIRSQICKFFLVALSYTLPDYLIPDLNDNLRTFQLMQDIGGLFMVIHRLPEGHPNQCTYGEGINDKEYVNCAEGLELCNAIKVLSR